MDKSTIVAIPARDEAERIGACLTALNAQTHLPDAVILLLNNCTDSTVEIARGMVSRLRFRLEIISRELPGARANAGCARRMAMAMAADKAGRDAVLLTTDADAVVPPDWVARNLGALRKGADVVCGRTVIDPREASMIPAHLHADDARECQLIGLLDELAWALDPEPHDPPPRHTEASGASLAVSIDAFHRVGGIPAIAGGEDRAFVRALWMMDARVRHDPAIEVMVSGRIDGRAPGGMADAIRRRMVRQDEFADDLAEPAADAFRRFGARQRARRVWSEAAATRSKRFRAHGTIGLPAFDRRGIAGRARVIALANDLEISAVRLREILAHRYFGAGWAEIEASSPILQRHRVRFAGLADEIVAARLLLYRLATPETLAAD